MTATAGGAPAVSKTEKQSTLRVIGPSLAPPAAVPIAQAPLEERADIARAGLAAASAARATSPSRIKIGWVDEGITARTKGTKTLVTMFPNGPPLKYYQDKEAGLRATVPRNQLRCIDLKMMYVLVDGKARRATDLGKGMLCGWCVITLRMPKFGEENLKVISALRPVELRHGRRS